MTSDQDSSSPDQKTQADRMLEIISEACLPFQDQYGRPYATFQFGDHWEVWSQDSRAFTAWLKGTYYKETGKTINKDALARAKDVLECRALHGGEVVELHNRMCHEDNVYWIDLTNKQWEAVRVAPKGWEVATSPTVNFQRYAHHLPQVTPVKGGSIKELLRFLRLKDGTQEILLLVYLVACFIPDVPRPLLHLYGDSGSMKSTASKMLRRIIDPSSTPLLALPRDDAELAQTFAHHFYPVFDNVSSITTAKSDMLCRAVTGEGFSKRELFTNDGDIIFAYKRAFCITAIEVVVQKPDLLERSVLIELEKIPEDERKTEKEVWEAFEKKLPRILGAVLTVLAKAIAIREKTALKKMPRMADFALWGCAIAEAMGYTQEEFLSAYEANISHQHEEAIEANLAATAVLRFMQGRQHWSGTTGQLKALLEKKAEQLDIQTKGAEWPRGPQAFSRRLNEAKSNLRKVGITITRSKGTQGMRLLTIEAQQQNTAPDAPTEKSPVEKEKPEVDNKGDEGFHRLSEINTPTLKKARQQAKKQNEGGRGDISNDTVTPSSK